MIIVTSDQELDMISTMCVLGVLQLCLTAKISTVHDMHLHRFIHRTS